MAYDGVNHLGTREWNGKGDLRGYGYSKERHTYLDHLPQ